MDITTESYSTYGNWDEKNILSDFFEMPSIKNLVHRSWLELFLDLMKHEKFGEIRKKLHEESQDPKISIYPKPDLVFNAFRITKFKKLKVVILGQDPYFDMEMHNNNNIPQAMGLSFSVPIGIEIPSSLKNIFANQKKFNIIENIPNHGNLEKWSKNGVLLLNTSLTVKHGSNNKNCHQNIWSWMTDSIIEYICKNKQNIMFVLWGANALEKKSIIDKYENNGHKLIISSHPSGLSCRKNLKTYPSFDSVNHFGIINDYLEIIGSKKIDWNLE